MAWSFYDSNGVFQSGDSGVSGANTALSNLASVAINTSLVSDADNTDDLGTSAAKWKDAYLFLMLMEERAAPGTPASGDVALYAKTDGLFYGKDDAGLETLLSNAEFDDQTLSGVATYDLSSIPATKGDMVIMGVLSPVDDGVSLYLRHNNRSSAGNFTWLNTRNIAGTVTGQNATAEQIEIADGGVGNLAGEGIHFVITVPSYASLPAGEQIKGVHQAGYRNAAGSQAVDTGVGIMNFAEDINRVTLLFATGNIDVGRVRTYLLGT